MTVCSFSHLGSLIGKLQRSFHIKNNCIYVIFNKHPVFRRKNISQYKNRFFYAVFPKIYGFRKCCDSKVLSLRLKRPGHCHISVTVSIGFNYCHKLSTLRRVCHKGLCIFNNGIQVYVSTNSVKFHDKTILLICSHMLL